jgi:hypothetical protein
MVFCEDFEAAALDPARWSITQSRATVTLDASRAARGRRSLHVAVTDPTYDGRHTGVVATRKAFPIAGAQLFVRAFVYIDPISTHRHYTVIGASGGGLGYAVNVVPAWDPPYQPAQFRYLWSHGAGEPGATYGKPPTQAPMGRWACWEWEIRGASNELRFQLDGRDTPAFRVDAPMGWTAPGTAQLRFGLDSAHAVSETFSLWIDEIAVSTERIGCM